jgi:hypothetical protein
MLTPVVIATHVLQGDRFVGIPVIAAFDNLLPDNIALCRYLRWNTKDVDRGA